MLDPLINTVREGVRYKGKTNQWMWVAHRVSGLGVLLFLVLHVFGMSMAYFDPPTHEAMLESYKTPLFSLGELALAACLIFHAVNGTRVAILELKPELWDKEAVATRWALIITALLAAPTILIMAAKSLSHFLTMGVK
jgi:succinate dehydrogenase / fumarate reductase cytochrome b subunit